MVDTASDDVIDMLDKRVGVTQHARPERLAREEHQLTCKAFFEGQQRFRIDDGRFFNQPYYDDEDEVHYKVNLVRTRTIQNAVKLLNVHMGFDARPPTGDMKDRERAETSKKVFRHLREATDFEYHQIQATLWKLMCGSAFYKVYWDPTIGDPDRFYWADETGRNAAPAWMFSAAQRQQKDAGLQFDDVPPGDIALGVLSPFAFYHDWSSRDGRIESCHWVAEKHYVDIERVAERWGIDEADIQPVEIAQGLANYEDALAFMSAGSSFGPLNFAVPRDKQRKRTLYIELWERPSAKYKRGRRIVYAGGKILNSKNTDNPYVGDRTRWAHLPYVHDQCTPTIGGFMGTGMVEDMLTPQFYLNESRGLMLQFMRKYGMPDTYADQGSGIDLDKFKEGGGNLYEIHQGAKVQHGPVPQMPATVSEITADLQADLNAVASQSEIENDKLPGQLRSGSAIQQIMEDRYSALSLPLMGTARAARDVGRVMLSLAKLYYDEPRVMRYLGEGNEWVVKQFTGADLINDIIITSKPNIADTDQNRKAEMLDWTAGGVFNPQYDKQTRIQIASALKFETNDEMIRVQLQAKRNQEKEIQEILVNPRKYEQGYPVMPWQDHETEMATLVEFMYSPQFELLGESESGRRSQAVISTHFEMHQRFAQQAQLQQAQMIEAMKGAPGQAGQASQPRSR